MQSLRVNQANPGAETDEVPFPTETQLSDVPPWLNTQPCGRLGLFMTRPVRLSRTPTRATERSGTNQTRPATDRRAIRQFVLRRFARRTRDMHLACQILRLTRFSRHTAKSCGEKAVFMVSRGIRTTVQNARAEAGWHGTVRFAPEGVG